MKSILKTLSLVVCFFMTASLSALAGNSDYYTKLNATATPTGAGLVYASTSNEAPAADAYQETVSTSATVDSRNHTYFLFAKPAAGHKLEGWYTDAECTTAAETTKDGDVYSYTVNAGQNATSEAAATEFNVYAKFIEALDAYSSTLNVHVVGPEGCTISVNGGASSGNASGSMLNTIDSEQRYTVSLGTDTRLNCRFVGWFTDEACTEYISRAKTLDYDVVATSTDADAPTQFHLYAKFEAFNEYQLRNGSFEDWETVSGRTSTSTVTGEEPLGWSSFITATGAMATTVRAVQLRKDSTEVRNGQFSARLNARSVMGIAMAQGNMTTGCINGGGMSATNANDNFNYTNEDGDEQAMYFAGRPDAMKVWIKSSCSGTVKIAAFLHEKGYFQDPVNGNVAKQVPMVASAEIAPESNDLTWTEYTVPFVYASDADPYYALVSFATSSVPGKGNASDYMFIDDVTMVYNSELDVVTFDGREVTFNDGAAKVLGDYDADLLSLTSNGVAATIETAYNEETRTLTICVKGQDISVNPENIHVYTLEFVKPMGPQGDNVNGNLFFSEAETLDDVLTTTITFDNYFEVAKGQLEPLAVVFDGTGLPYAFLYAPYAGSYEIAGNVVKLHFAKMAELDAQLQAAANKVLGKIGAFKSEGKACMVVSAKSFCLDAAYDNTIIVKDYEFTGEGGTVTGIEALPSTSVTAPAFDLQGRRTNAHHGVLLQNGKKVVR